MPNHHHNYHRPAPIRRYSDPRASIHHHSYPREDYGKGGFDDGSTNAEHDKTSRHHHSQRRHNYVNVRDLEERLNRLKADSPDPLYEYDSNSEPIYESEHKNNKDSSRGNRTSYRDSGYHEHYYPDDVENQQSKEPHEYYSEASSEGHSPYHSSRGGDRRRYRHREDPTFNPNSHSDPRKYQETSRERSSRRSSPPLVREALIGLASDILGEFTRHTSLFRSRKSTGRNNSPPIIHEGERIRTLTPSPVTSLDDLGEGGVKLDSKKKSSGQREWEMDSDSGDERKDRSRRRHKHREKKKNRDDYASSEKNLSGKSVTFASTDDFIQTPPSDPVAAYKTPQYDFPENREQKTAYHQPPPTTLGSPPVYPFKQEAVPPARPMVKPASMFAQYGYNQIPPEVWKEDVIKRPAPPSVEVSPTSRGINSTIHEIEEPIDITDTSHRSKKGKQKDPRNNNKAHGNSLTTSEAETETDGYGEDDDDIYGMVYSPQKRFTHSSTSTSDSERSFSSSPRREHAKSRAKNKNSSDHKYPHQHRRHHRHHRPRRSDSSSRSRSGSRSQKQKSKSGSRRHSRDPSTDRDLQRYPDVPKQTVENLERKPLHQQILPLLEVALEIIESLNEIVSVATGGHHRSSLVALLGPFAGKKHHRRKRRGRGGDSEFGVLRAVAMIRTLKRIRKEMEKRTKERQKEKERERKEREMRHHEEHGAKE